MAFPRPETVGQDDNVDLELRLGLPPLRVTDCSTTSHAVKIPAAVETGLVVLEVITDALESGSSGIDYATPDGSMSPPAPSTEPLHEVTGEEALHTSEEALHGDLDANGTVPAWVRAELLPRYDLPRDTPLHFIGAKNLSSSDLNPHQARFLVPSISGASDRLRAFLSADEIQACGFDLASRNPAGGGGRSQRTGATRYPGVPVSVYERDMPVPTELKLNKFHGTSGTVINGTGYTSFMARCRFEAGDHVELWAFRRPADHLCVVIAKRT